MNYFYKVVLASFNGEQYTRYKKSCLFKNPIDQHFHFDQKNWSC